MHFSTKRVIIMGKLTSLFKLSVSASERKVIDTMRLNIQFIEVATELPVLLAHRG